MLSVKLSSMVLICKQVNNIYSFKKESRVYSLICFANELNENERSDRVIANKWDAAFTLHDGIPTKEGHSLL